MTSLTSEPPQAQIRQGDRKPSISEILASQKPPAPVAADNPPKLDWYASARAPSACGKATLKDLIDGIKSDEFKERVEKVRALIEAGKSSEADDLKKMLPAVSISGAVTGRRKLAAEEGRFIHSGFLQIDLDAKDHPRMSLTEMRDLLFADPHIQAIFVSPSGAGVKGVARIPADLKTHKAAFLTAEKHYAGMELKIDRSCKDAVRLCFVSYDPHAWLRASPAVEFMIDPEILQDLAPAASDTEEEEDEGEEGEEGEGHAVTNHTFSATGGLVIRANASHYEITPDIVKDMLSHIPYPGYDGWLKIANAVWSAVGEAGTEVLQAWVPEKNPGDYASKYKYRLQDVKAGTLVMMAKEHGWEPTHRQKLIQKKALKKARKEKWTAVSPAIKKTAEGSTPQSFAPEDIFYDTRSSAYLVKVGKTYLTFSKRNPVNTGLSRHFEPKYEDSDDAKPEILAALNDREVDGAVQWSGAIAGHRQGLAKDSNDLPILITSEANLPEPIAGDAKVINMILDGAFSGDDPTARNALLSWMKTRYLAVRKHVHVPGPMLVLAGEVNSGKSLIAMIIQHLLGGRVGHPHKAWSEASLWNDDLVGCELLLVDDCVGSTDIRARRNFGASFKGAIYANKVQVQKRNTSSVYARPVWSVVVCCNDTPESMQIIPPIDADLDDKIMLLHVTRSEGAVGASTPDDRVQLENCVRGEMAAFAHQLINFEIPAELQGLRSGVKAWRDPHLSESLETISPGRRLEALLEAALVDQGIWHDLPCELTSAEIEGRLLEFRSPVRDQAKAFCSWGVACGSGLASLVKMGSDIVSAGTPRNKKKPQRYSISR